MGIVLKVVHADKSVGTIELGSDSKVAFKQGDRVDVSEIKNLKDVEIDKNGNVVLTFPEGKVVLSNLPKEQVEALVAQLPSDEVSTASTQATGKAMTGLLLLSLQSMLKSTPGGALEFNTAQNFAGNAVKLDFGASQTPSDGKTTSFSSFASSGISLSASFVSVINGKEEAAAVEDGITSIKASLTVTNPVLKDVSFVAQSFVKGEYGTFSISKDGDWTYQLNNGSQKVQGLSVGETVSDTFKVASSDGSAAADVKVAITGSNDAPVLAAGRISTSETAASASLDLKALASDIDSDDDPSSLRYSIVGQPDHGSAKLSGSSLIFSPGSDFASLRAGESATETIKVRVTDRHGATTDNLVTVTVAGVDDAPVLRNGNFSLGEDETSRMALSGFVSVSGTSNRALDFAITSQPEAGSAAIVNGQLVFTPGAVLQALEFGETREVEVGLRGTNSAGLSAETTAHYKVTGAPDKAIPSVVTVTVKEDDGPISIDLMSIVSDRSHNPELTFIRTSNNGAGELSFSLDPKMAGVLTFDPNGEFSALGAGQSSTVVANFQISDALGHMIRLPVNIVVVGSDDAPDLREGHFSLSEDETGTMALSGFVEVSGTSERALDFAITSQPDAGSASIVDGQLVFTPGKELQALEFGEAREVEIGLRGTNTAGLSADTTVHYNIVGAPDKPIPSVVTVTVKEDDGPVSIDLMSIVSDRSHNPDLTFIRTSNNGAGELSLSIDPKTAGVLTFDPNGEFNTLNAGQSSTVVANFQISDAFGHMIRLPVNFVVVGSDDAPDMREGHFSLGEDETASIALSSFVETSGTSNRTLDFAITSQPDAGSASIVDGRLVFAPGAAFQGLEFGETRDVEVGLRGTNSAGLSADTTVHYQVIGAADKPIPSVVTVTVKEDDGPISVDLMSIVSDRSHNPDLTFIRTSNNGAGELSLSIDPKTAGILTFDPNGEFNALNAGQSSTVVTNFQISDAFRHTIQLSVHFVVNGANEVPVVIDGHLDAQENGASVAMKLASLVKSTGLDDGVAPKFQIVEQPEKGLATLANGQLVFNPAKGFDDLAKGESRDVDVTVRVTNSQGESADATVTVTVTGTNDAPTVSDKTLTITESATASIDLTTLVDDVDSDDSAQTLKYAITGEPKLGSASLKGTTLTFETGGGFEGLAKGETRTVEIDLSATDRHGATDKGTVKITVTGENDAPTLSAARMSVTEDGASVTLDLTRLAADIDSDDDAGTLTYSIVKGPVEGSARVSGTSLVFDPGQGFQSLEEGETRDVTVTVRASDKHGASADAIVTVIVTGLHDGETTLLSSIAAGEGGFRIVGERAGDMAGLSVSSAGDFNGDGFDDFIIGAPGNDATGGFGSLPETLADHGAVYVVYGKEQRPDQINLDDVAAGRGGFKIIPGSTLVRDPSGGVAISPDSQNFTGMSVAAAGDVNGDGFADILIGGPGSTQFRTEGNALDVTLGAGGAYVIFGQANTIGSVNLDDMGEAFTGFRIEGESGRSLFGSFSTPQTGIFAGMDVASAGDVNGDGLDDLVIGSRDGAYIVLGQTGEATVNLDAVADGTGGFKVTLPSFPGRGNFLGGVTVSALGDIDKDGFDDVAVGSNFGISRIIYGSATLGTMGGTSSAPASSNITVEGAAPLSAGGIPVSDSALVTISGLGDVNGDNIADYMIGVATNAEGGAQAGAAYVVFGRDGVRSDLSLTDIANGIGGFKIVGEAAGNAAGISVAAAGDLNGDGFTDLVIGASTDRSSPLAQLGLALLDDAVAQAGSGAGSAYVVYGTAHPTGEINLDTIARGIGGFKLTGETSGDHAGIAVASAGDIDGDGFDDLLVGANLNDAGGTDAGAAYVVYGGFSLPNDSDHAHIAGDLDGDVIGARIETATGRLTATFADGRSEGFVAETLQGEYGSFTLLADGSWTYRLDPDNADVKVLPLGKSLAESFKVKAEDGSAVNVVAIDITAAPPVTGDLTTSLIEDYRLAGSGTIGVQGSATARFVALTQVQGTFGTFDLTADGHWQYQLDPLSEAVQALLPGDDATDRFAVATTDGVGRGTVTVHIDGTFDFTTFGGDRSETINEDAAGASGVVKAIDLFAGALDYRAMNVQGQFGTFHLGTNGAWTYDLDNGNAAVRSLGTGAALTEQFTVSEAGDRFTQRVSIRIEGANDAPVVTAINAGTVSEDDATVTIDLLAGQTDEETAVLSALSISVTDDLGHAVAFLDNGNGTISIDPAQFNDLGSVLSRAVTISYKVSDGVAGTANTATLMVQGANDPAEIGGVASGAVTEDGQTTVSGLLTVADSDAGEAGFSPVSPTDGDFGRFSMDAGGHWTYQLDNANARVQALGQGETLSETFVIQSSDGTIGEVGITINGADETGGNPTGAPSQILLSSLAGGQYGLKIIGGAYGDRAGYSVSSAGDFNGDGVDDLLVSAMYDGNFGGRVAATMASESDSGPDTAFIVFGGHILGGTIDLADVGFSIGGVRIAAESAAIQYGITVASLGDFNGDGLADIAIGAQSDHEAGYSAGAAYVIYGTAQAPQTIQLSEIALGNGGFKILGENEYDTAGTSVSAAGDINGDGYADVIIGAPNNSSTADYSDNTGAAYVVLGSGDRTSTLDLQLMQKGSEGFKIGGEEPYQLAGYAVSSAGDINQDGYGDYVIGAYGGYSNGFYKGAAYLVYGSGNSISSVDLEQLNFGLGGFKISGAAEFDEAGFSVAAAGDVNGDGLDDFLIGAPFDAPYYGMVEGKMAGKAYVVYGRGDVPYGVDLEHMTLGTDGGTRSVGLRIIGENDLDRAGASVSSAGDINGDGLADILIGAPANGEGGSGAGAAYVIFGQTDRTGDIHLRDIAAGHGGFKLVGEAVNDVAGSTVAAAGDVNRDGFDDLLVGARGNDVAEGDDRGAAYVLFGGAYLGGQDYQGTGNDDTIAVSNVDFARVDGKEGFDTLLVQGADMVLDFTKLAQDRVSSIEMIDMAGHGDNSLKLSAEDVFDMSQAVDGNTTSLVVKLDRGDTLDLSGEGWTSGGTRLENGINYDVFTNAALGTYNVAVLVDRFQYHEY